MLDACYSAALLSGLCNFDHDRSQGAAYCANPKGRLAEF